MRKTAFGCLAVILCLALPGYAAVWLSVEGKPVLPAGEMRLNRGETIVLEIVGDGTTAQPLGGSVLVEGPGAINGHTLAYSGLGSAYDDLEEVAEAMEMTTEEALAVFKGSTGRDLTDMSKWVLADSGIPPKHLQELLITDIVFRCEGEGDALLTLETDEPSATFPARWRDGSE